MGTSGGCCGDVHPTFTRIAIPVTGEDSGDWVREHVYQWDFYPSSCHLILLYIYNLDSCHWCSYTIWLILATRQNLSFLRPCCCSSQILNSSLKAFAEGGFLFLSNLFLCYFSFELVSFSEIHSLSVVTSMFIKFMHMKGTSFWTTFIIFSVHDGS